MNGDALALIGVAASGITNGIINGITMGFPSRPKWVAFVAALIIGIIAAAVGAFAYLPPDLTFNRQVWAQVVIVGIGAGLAAAGLGVSQASAQSKREEAQAAAAGPATSPDPVNPSPRVGGG
jgi:hypothetical protein